MKRLILVVDDDRSSDVAIHAAMQPEPMSEWDDKDLFNIVVGDIPTHVELVHFTRKDETLAFLRTLTRKIDVLVLDGTLPDGHGIDVLAAIFESKIVVDTRLYSTGSLTSLVAMKKYVDMRRGEA